MKLWFLCIASLLVSLTVKAAPMGFKDSWMTMSDFSKTYRELTVNYALTPRDAIGVTSTYMQTNNQSQSQLNNELTYTRLVKRWNMPDAQANIWFIGGVGETTGNYFNGAKATVSPGMQADYETTRLYASANARIYVADGITNHVVSTRTGFSFYEANYEETQPWLIVEIRKMSMVSSQYEVTPMIRLIHNRFFVEAGANLQGQPRLSFMYVY
ncbi:MAG: hypothetical protein HQ456_00935 [Polynucleobacter sp.]|jgi:hypothetical protein|nr:hypothetical protein [Polynucleobacter sp.]